VVLALRNAVRDGRVAHAYLFSGPRGTGKTSTARILAKALNCTNLEDGEPCGVCASCVEIAKGTSLDVHELDAASNNGVEAMRDLVSRAALGTPGRQKVYIVDEVHMLSTAASNALLKTLEEPPAHVVFVLATTDPQKVLPTIRSRTQHFEFRLLDAETLGSLLTQVRNDAHLDVADEALDVAIRRGKGSARDALSVLDQVAASDTVDDDLPQLSEIAAALAERDSSRALVAVAQLTSGGWSPQQLAGDLIEHLRQAFLTMVAPELVSVGDTERVEIAGLAERLGLAAVVRGMEVLGLAQVAMREAPDPRVNLEVALVRLAHPDVDVSPEALVARIERLERGAPVPTTTGGETVVAPVAVPTARPHAPTAGTPKDPAIGGSSPSVPRPAAPPAAQATPSSPEAVPSSASSPVPAVDPTADSTAPSPSAGGRKTLGAVRRQTGAPAPRGPGAAPGPGGTEPGAPSSTEPETPTRQNRRGTPAKSSSATGGAPEGSAQGSAPMPTRDELVEAWGDHVLGRLRPKAKALFQAGRFVGVEGDTAQFGLPNETHRMRCEEVRADVEAVLSEHFGRRVGLVLIVDDGPDGQEGTAGRTGAAGPEAFTGAVASDGPRVGQSGASGAGGSGSGGSRPGGSGSRGASGSGASSAPTSGSGVASGSDAPPPVSGGSGSGVSDMASSAEDFSAFDEGELGEVADVDTSPAARVLQAFPGAEEVN
jgi:DNA polymerase-3 subunit gamma/tau